MVNSPWSALHRVVDAVRDVALDGTRPPALRMFCVDLHSALVEAHARLIDAAEGGAFANDAALRAAIEAAIWSARDAVLGDGQTRH